MKDHTVESTPLVDDPNNPIPDKEEWDRHGIISTPADSIVEQFAHLPPDSAKVLAYLTLVAAGRGSFFAPFLSASFISKRLHMPFESTQELLDILSGDAMPLESIAYHGQVGYRLYLEYDRYVIDDWEAWRTHSREERRLAEARARRTPAEIRAAEKRAALAEAKRSERDAVRAEKNAVSKRALRNKPLALQFHLTCVYCKRVGTDLADPDGATWHQDHVWPKVHGGGAETNFVLACRQCNTRKHSMAATEFLEMLKAEGTLKAAD